MMLVNRRVLAIVVGLVVAVLFYLVIRSVYLYGCMWFRPGFVQLCVLLFPPAVYRLGIGRPWLMFVQYAIPLLAGGVAVLITYGRSPLAVRGRKVTESAPVRHSQERSAEQTDRGGDGPQESITVQTSSPISIGRSLALGLADPAHPARAQIAAAAQIADQVIQLKAAGGFTMMQVEGAGANQLVAAIDGALAQAPDDPDLLVAKSGALCCAMQFKTAEEIIDQVLARWPDHFEARMRKEHWSDWNNLFHFPPWSDKAARLHPLMAQAGQLVQVVRDGLQLGVAVVRPVQRGMFPGGLSPQMRSKWELVWSETPYGPIVAHYIMVEDDPSDPFKAEGSIAPVVVEKDVPNAGYWLLKRLALLRSCFLVLADGDTVLYNRRYLFPDSFVATLKTISQKMTYQKVGPDQGAAIQRAMRWHEQNFDMARIRF